MAFPASTVSVPTLTNFQMSFRSVTMGPSTAYEFQKLEGIRGMPQVRGGDAGRPRDHGDFIGLDLLAGRDVTLGMEVGPPFSPATTLPGALATLATALVPSGTTEYPLFFCENSVTYACMARARRKDVPIDIAYAQNLAQNVNVQFHAVDPRWYSTPTTAQTCGLPTPVGGFAFPLAFPLSFGSGSFGNTITFANAGNIDCRPVLTVTGPCTYPSISNSSVTGNPSVTFGVSMAAGDQLVIDMDFHSATYYPVNSSLGYSVSSTLQTNSTWWTLPAASTSIIVFSSNDTTGVAGTMSMQAASAYIL